MEKEAKSLQTSIPTLDQLSAVTDAEERLRTLEQTEKLPQAQLVRLRQSLEKQKKPLSHIKISSD